MRLRDENASAYSSIFILRELAPEVLARVPDALHRIVTSRDAKVLRRRWHESPGRRSHLSIREAGAVARAHVLTACPSMSDSELFGLHHRLGFDRLPVSLVIAGDRLSIKSWHLELDGEANLAFMHRLVDLACGLPDTPFPRAVRLPVLRGAVRASAPLAVKEALAYRRDHVTPMQSAPEPTDAQRLREAVHLDSAELDERVIAAVRRATDERTTVNSALIAAVAETAAEIHRGQGDPVVSVPVHLGKWAGGPVVGNFILNHRLGGLRSTRWHPCGVRDLLAEAQTRAGFGGFLWDLQWPLKARIRRRSAVAAAQPELTVQISAIRSPRPFPTQAWVSGRPNVVFGSIGPYPAFFTLLWRVGDAVVVAVEDETHAFDSSQYMSVLSRKLGDLIGVRAEPSPSRALPVGA